MALRGLGDSYGGYRTQLMERVREAGVKDMAVLAAVADTPRHLFVPDALRARAYDDASLPIGNGQTISQPSTHARYLEALRLRGTERVLEVGTGTGYQAALLSRLVDHVISIERIAELFRTAQAALQAAGCGNVTVLMGDGTLGRRSLGPYHAIVVAAAGPKIPTPLVEQLADGGRLVIPLQTDDGQVLVRLTRNGDEVRREELGPAQFVPLVGRHGFAGS